MYRRNLTRIEIKLEDIQEFGNSNQAEIEQQYLQEYGEGSSATSNLNANGSGNNVAANGTVGGSSSKTTQTVITRQTRIGLRR